MWFISIIVASILSLVSTAALNPSVLSSSTLNIQTPFNCEVRSWVRSPDLLPSQIQPAQVRWNLNGSDCTEFVKAEVGLRFRERSLVKIPKSDVELPEMPIYNQTLEEEYWNTQDDMLSNNVFAVGMNDNWMNSPYSLARKAYEEASREQSLWEVYAKERLVFDERITLQNVQLDESLPMESVQDFLVAVPNTNFPPSTDSSRTRPSWNDKETELALEESELTYYLLLTLRNGTSLEYLAGKTVFLPIASTGLANNNLELQNYSVPLLRQENCCEQVLDQMPGNSCPKPNNATSFEIILVAPSRPYHFKQGEQIFLQANIKRNGPASEIPSYISFSYDTRNNLTWAGKFGRNLEEKSRLEGRGYKNEYFYQGQLGSKLQIKTKEVKSILEESTDNNERGGSFYRYSERSVGGTILNSTEESQSVMVNFTIPHDALPSFNLTFKEFVSYLQIRLHTISSNSSEIPLPPHLRKLTLDEEWSDERPAVQFLQATTEDNFKHFGNLSIIIDPALTQNSSIGLHYTNIDALAPKLIAISADSLSFTDLQLSTIEFPKVSTILVSDVPLQKYGKDKNKKNRNNFFLRDGAHQLTGQVWARKLRREQDEREVEGTKFIIQA